jgi:hypothetical protein
VNPSVGSVWVHPSGLRLLVIGQHVPGDRNDELRVWCEVIEDKQDRYRVGYRDGWVLIVENRWRQE